MTTTKLGDISSGSYSNSSKNNHVELLCVIRQETWLHNNSSDTVIEASDPIGHHPGVQLQKEGLEFAQLTPRLLFTGCAFLVHASIFPLLILLLLLHPGYPGSVVAAGVSSWVVGWKVHRHGCLVVVGEPRQQLLDHGWPLRCQVLPLVRVGGDVEEPHGFLGRGRREGAFKIPPLAGERGQQLGGGGRHGVSGGCQSCRSRAAACLPAVGPSLRGLGLLSAASSLRLGWQPERTCPIVSGMCCGTGTKSSWIHAVSQSAWIWT